MKIKPIYFSLRGSFSVEADRTLVDARGRMSWLVTDKDNCILTVSLHRDGTWTCDCWKDVLDIRHALLVGPHKRFHLTCEHIDATSKAWTKEDNKRREAAQETKRLAIEANQEMKRRALEAEERAKIEAITKLVEPEMGFAKPKRIINLE